MAQVSFHGTQTESRDLSDAFARYCACTFDESSGARTSVCVGHQALVGDQDFLNRVLFYRRMRERLKREEWLIDTSRTKEC